MRRLFTFRCLLVMILGLLNKASVGQAIFTNPINDANPSASNPYITGQNFDGNIVVSGISRGTGLTQSAAANRYSASSWSTGPIDANDYFEFTLAPNSGIRIDFVSFIYTGQVSTGTPSFSFRSSLDGYTTDIGTPTETGTSISLAAAAYQGITTAITFRFYAFGLAATGTTYSINDFTFNGLVSAITPKYYRSITSGDWSTASTWESSTDNTTWGTATLTPSSSDAPIIIQSPNVVTVSKIISLDETTIDGTLQVLSTNSYNSTINPGPSASAITISSGGKIQIGDGAIAVGAGYEIFATSALNVWNTTSVFEWNSSTPFAFNGQTYFPNANTSTLPIFRVSTSPSATIGGSNISSLNGILDVKANITYVGAGEKTIRDGIMGNSILTFSGGNLVLSSTVAFISGTVQIVANGNLKLSNGVTIPSGSDIKISGSASINKTSGSFLVNGIVDVGNLNISNASGNITANGTLKTSNTNGLYAGGATIVSGTLNLNAGSTIEYNASGPQTVQGLTLPPYYNVTFSGSGTKTLVSANNPTGTITVSGSAIFDAGNSTFGTTGTKLTMTGISRYITGGAATKPDAQGTYTLGSGTTIEFALGSATTVRLGSPTMYANVIVSGTNVSNASSVTGIAFQAGGSFTINANAIFKLDNNTGFSGGASTAISSTNNPAINLLTGSTLEYSGGTNQTVTNQIPYQNLTIAGTGNKTAPSGILTMQGNLTKSGTSSFIHNSGTVLLNGTNQTFAGLTYNNLVLSNGGTKTTAGSSIIIDSIKVSASTTLGISANDSITLHSDVNKTARVGQVDGSINYNSTGKFVVERYISPKRAWRFLSVPTNNTQTIKEAWQEGALSSGSNPVPGYGTQITNNTATWAADGFDYYSPNGASLKTYNAGTNTWVGISNTSNPIKTSEGLMTFVRGDRTSAGLYAAPAATVLRTRGSLYTGDKIYTVNAGEFTSIGNPYASPLDMTKITKTGVEENFYLYDPDVNTLGAFQTFYKGSGSDNNYYPLVPGGSYTTSPYNYIQGGLAFFVRGDAAGGSLNIAENSKVSSATAGNLLLYRPPSRAPNQGQVNTNLYAIESDGSSTLVDAVLVQVADNYSNTVDRYDAKKITNISENLSIKTDGRLLAVERRAVINPGDTIHLNLLKVKTKSYRLECKIQNLDAALTGFIEDRYNGKRIPLNIMGTSTYDFDVVDVPASWDPNRFIIVFAEAVGSPLAVTFASLKAYQQNTSVTVEWNVDNEKNIKEYIVEKSVNGQQFIVAKTIATNSTNRLPISYQWLDENPAAGSNFYRIRSVTLGGETQYSAIVKLVMGSGTPQIRVTPNPVIGNTFNLQLTNLPEGNYDFKLLNNASRVMSSFIINHKRGSSSEPLKLNKSIPAGIYLLKINGPGDYESVLKISKQ
ncbi:MAG: hypothetical protein ABIO55_05745 [Ginsengibacter sp.]